MNFALFSEHATAVELCLFDAAGEETRIAVTQSTDQVWHIALPEARPGQRLLAFTRRVIALRRGHPALRRRQFFYGRRIRGSEVKDLTWFRPDGWEMSEEDWQNALTRALGLRMSGDAVDEVDARGEPIVDDTFLIVINGHHESIDFMLPAHRRGVRWEPVLDTRIADGQPPRRLLKGGEAYALDGRCMVVLTMRRNGGRGSRTSR